MQPKERLFHGLVVKMKVFNKLLIEKQFSNKCVVDINYNRLINHRKAEKKYMYRGSFKKIIFKRLLLYSYLSYLDKMTINEQLIVDYFI